MTEAICVRCFVQFPIDDETAEWIKEDGVRVLCPTCMDEEAEATGEAAERRRQPENQPIPELVGGPCWHGDSRSCRCDD